MLLIKFIFCIFVLLFIEIIIRHEVIIENRPNGWFIVYKTFHKIDGIQQSITKSFKIW